MDVQSSLNISQSSSSSPSSPISPALSPILPLSLPAHPPTSEEIDAVIQQATSSVSPDGRHVPLKDTRTQLFVGNLPYRVRWQDLKDLFRKAGTVLRADVSLGPDNRSRGHGTVLLATAEDAGRAVDIFNGYSWQSRVLEVRLDRLPNDFDNFSNPTPGYHTPTLVSTHTPAIPGLRPTYPFPTAIPPPINSLLSTSFVPQIPLRSALDESYPDHSTVFGHDRPTTVGGISRNLFVGNLPFHCQWQDLKDLFRQAGTVLRADVALGQDGRSRGFGTVVLATEHDAERAVNMFNGYEYNGRLLKVHYDKFMPSVGQSLTAPSSPLITSPFSGINATSLASMAHISVRPTSSRSTPLPLTHLSHSLDYTAYISNQVKSTTSPSPLNVFPSLSRPQSHAVFSHLGTTLDHQLPIHISTGPGLPDRTNPNPSSHGSVSPSIGFAELPTPPSSSAGVPSSKGSRVSSPPLHLSQPILKQDLPSHHPPTHSLSAPVSFTASTYSIYPEQGHSSQMLVSSPQAETLSRLEQTSPPSRQRAQTHPAHPGPISLPPPSTFVVPATHNFSPMSPMVAPGTHISPLQQSGVLPIPSPHAHPQSPLNRPMFSLARSPLHHPTHIPSLNITPSGLPPITPSMPSFQFVSGPPTLPHSEYSAVIISPVSTMSPGAFWGRPGGNPLTNAAVGAPVTKGQSSEEFDYFSCPSIDDSKGESHFLSLSQTGGRLADEILREEPGDTSGISERPTSSPAMENGIGQEVSTSNGSSGRRSANERIGASGIDGVIEQLHSGLNISLPEKTPRTEMPVHSRASSPFPHPPTRRAESDPVQEQGHRSSGCGMVRRASFTEVGHTIASGHSE